MEYIPTGVNDYLSLALSSEAGSQDLLSHLLHQAGARPEAYHLASLSLSLHLFSLHPQSEPAVASPLWGPLCFAFFQGSPCLNAAPLAQTGGSLRAPPAGHLPLAAVG